MDNMKKEKGYAGDTDLTAEDLKILSEQFKKKVKEVLGKAFPMIPWNSYGGLSVRYLSAGTANGLFHIAGSKAFRMNGERPSMSRPWFSAIWAIIGHGCGLYPESGHR